MAVKISQELAEMPPKSVVSVNFETEQFVTAGDTEIDGITVDATRDIGKADTVANVKALRANCHRMIDALRDDQVLTIHIILRRTK